MIRKKILIVEDDIDLAEMLIRKLDVSEYETTAVYSVEEAIGLMHMNFKPDLILLDLGLKKVSGVALLNFMRKRDYREVPIIVMSGYTSPEIVEYTFDMGAKAFLSKPYSTQELLSTVNYHVN